VPEAEAVSSVTARRVPARRFGRNGTFAHTNPVYSYPTLATENSNLEGFDVLLTNGGTGIANRDQTINVVESMIDQRLPGFGELFRMLSYAEIGPAAMLSRATAGTFGAALIFCLPGSTGAVRLAMERLIIPELPHLVWETLRQ